MQEFSVGQRWINDAELQLGLGTVLEIEARTVTIFFQATDQKRTYARQTAPLTRITYSVGEHIKHRDGTEIMVESIHESEGLKTYVGRDSLGSEHEINEVLLDYHVQLNRPSDRLLSGQIDTDKWFELRYQSLLQLNRISHSQLRGLTGSRVSLIPHQLYIAHEVARRYAPRVLLADEVGLGKTIEAGLILHQQLLTERANRVLVVVPESLVHQWLVELLRRFNLHFSIFDDDRYLAIREQETGENPFHSDQLVLCSLGFLTGDQSILNDALNGEWDMLVVDEAHHLQWEPGNASPEYITVEQLAGVTSGVLLLTATPEQLGKTGHFARLRLLDPNRFPDFESFVEEEKHYKPVADSIELLFSEETPTAGALEILTGSLEEDDRERFLSAIDADDQGESDIAAMKEELVEHLLDRHGTGRVLFRNTRTTVSGFPQRKLHAYPLSMPDIYHNLYDSKYDPELLLKPEQVYDAENAALPVRWSQVDPRVEWLQNKLSDLRPARVLVIAASAKTVLQLAEALRIRAGMHLAVFHEQMNLVERDRAAAWFADEEEGCQALLCSEIGSEGRNFQFAHHLVLFDLPLDPDLLEQRIGRLDRIGQTQVINVHVPYMGDSSQGPMFRWLHEGLNAFERSSAAASIVFNEVRPRLLTALSGPETDISELLEDSGNRLRDLETALHQGRDRLLEYNSCRPALATSLQQQAEAEDRESTLEEYMESVFDCFGVHSEEQSSDRFIIRPGENMLTAFPHLQEDGMSVTYARKTALSNEDIHYLSWDHPMVTGAMDIVLTSELGNTSLVAMEYEGISEGTLLLESIYVYESASSQVLQTSRYLPPTTIRIVIDESGESYEKELSHETINRCSVQVDRETAGKIIRMKTGELRQMNKLGEARANSFAPAILKEAHQKAAQLLMKEVERLRALARVNRNVRNEEITHFEEQLNALDQVLDAASLRLDALRVIIST